MNTPQEILDAAGIQYQIRNNGHHYIVEGPKGFIDYWPSTGQWRARTPGSESLFGIQELIAYAHPKKIPSLDQAGEISQLKEELYNTQHELALLIDGLRTLLRARS